MPDIAIEDLTPKEGLKRIHKLLLEKDFPNEETFMETLLKLQSEYKLKFNQMVKLLDDLHANHTELFEKYESLNNYIYGYVKALEIELANHREGFFYLYKGLGIPYDEIKGWDILDEPEQPKRRSNRFFSQIFFRTRTNKKKQKDQPRSTHDRKTQKRKKKWRKNNA